MKQRLASLFRLLLLALLAGVGVTVPAPAAAQSGLTLTAEPAFGGNYMPGAWLPVTVSLVNDGPPRNVLLAATLPGTSFRNVLPAALPAGGELRLVLYVAMEQETRELRLSAEEGGSILAETAIAVRSRRDERLLGILAEVDPQLNLPRRQDLSSLPFTTAPLSLAGLPDRAAGLSSLGLLMMSDIVTADLKPDQIRALLGWVDRGGHLVLGGGALAERVLVGLPPELQPAAIGDERAIGDEPLAALTESPGPGPLPGVQLIPYPDALGVGSKDAPAWVVRPFGRGLVTQLAFDPGLPALNAWAGAPQFWDGLLRPAMLISTPLGLQTSADVVQEQIIGGALTALPAISLPPTNLIFLILAAYAVVVGPGVALLLRRFDRQAWAWALVPAFALGVGALVFGLAFALRADQRVITQLSLVEAINQDSARARTYLALYAPQDQQLEAAVGTPALIRPVRGASGQYGSVSGAVGDLAQEQATVTLTVDGWQLQGLAAEAQTSVGGVTAEIEVGADPPRVVLQNGGNQRLLDTVAVYGERLAFLGTIQPGERVAAAWPAAPPVGIGRNEPISYLILREALEAGRRPGQAPERSVLAREALINAAVTRGDAGVDEGPLIFVWLEQSPLSLDLPVEGASREDTTLLTLRPAISGSGPVALPVGWLRPVLNADGRGPCFGEQGAGVPASTAPVLVRLRLPAGFAALKAEALTLSFDSSQRWPGVGVITELYNWDESRWVEQEFDGPGDLEVLDAAPFMRSGQVLVRFDGQIASAGCLYADATVRGTLP